MIDAELIQQCADPRLNVEIVQQFVEQISAADHLTITVKQGERVILVPKPETVEQAIATTRERVGQATVRVGLTQYPAGLGIADPSQIGYALFDNCDNLRMGTELFGKVYRIVTKWYGNPRPEAFNDAIWAYGTGWFEGEQIFYAEDPADVDVATPAPPADQIEAGQRDTVETGESGGLSEPPFSDEDPNRASIRIDLTGIRAHNNENTSGQ
jgi:hypothetical protein